MGDEPSPPEDALLPPDDGDAGESESEEEKKEEEEPGLSKDGRPQGPTPIYEVDEAAVDQGSVVDKDGVKLYQTGPVGPVAGVLLISDFYGWNTGRARAIADYLATSLNALAVVPRLLDKPCMAGAKDEDGMSPEFDIEGKAKEFRNWLMRYVWSSFEPKVHAALTLLRNSGVKRIACIGFGFGCWILSKASEKIGEMVCSSFLSPNLHTMEDLLDGSVSRLASRICGTMLCMVAQDDDQALYGPERSMLSEAIMRNWSESAEFYNVDTVQTAWVLRGNTADPDVKAEVEKAVLMISKFFRKFLWPPPVGANAATLRLMCEEGDADMVQTLLAAGVPAGGKDARDTIGLMPMHYAAKSQTSVYPIRQLIDFEADVNATGGIAWEAPIHIAANIGNTKVIKALLQARADTEKTDKGGQTALHMACRFGSLPVVKQLLKAGASWYPRDEPSQQTPLHLAAWFGKEDIVVHMLRFQMDVDPVDLREQTPQRRAMMSGYDAVANLFEAERKRREDEAFFLEQEAS